MKDIGIRPEIDFEAIPIVERPPTIPEMKKMIKFVGGDFKKLFNTSGLVYRELKLGSRLGSMTEAEALELLASNGKLIKRPFLITDKSGTVGFRVQEWKNLLGG